MTGISRRQLLQALAAVASASSARAQTLAVRTIAGTGAAGFNPAVADALTTPVNNPYGVVVGPDGGLYFCEYDTGRVRRFDPQRRTITTLAGTGEKGHTGDGGPATRATLAAPHELRFDGAGHLFVVERDSHVIRRIDRDSGVISTVAGNGTAGFSGDGGAATAAQFRQPHSIAFDAAGQLLVCDIGNARIRRVDLQQGTVSTFAGTGERGPTPDDAPIDGTPLNGPRSLDVAPDGAIYLVLREGNAVFRIDPVARRLSRVAGTGAVGFSGDGGPAPAATFNGPKGIAWAPDNSLLVVDTENHAIRRINLASGRIETVLGTGERGDGPDGDPRQCRMARPHGVCVMGNLVVVSDSENHRIRTLG